MFYIDKMRMYTQKVSSIRFPRNNKYIISYFGENLDFSEAYPNMHLMRQDVRKVFVPKIKVQNILVSNVSKYNQAIKKYGLQTFSARKDKFSKAHVTHIYDLSILKDRISTYVGGKFYKHKAISLVSHIFPSSQKNFKRVIMYTIDVAKPIELAIRFRAIYPLIFNYRENKNIDEYCDYFIMCVLDGDGKPYYVKLYDSSSKANSYIRFYSVLRGVKNMSTDFTQLTDQFKSLFANEVETLYGEPDKLNKDIHTTAKNEVEETIGGERISKNKKIKARLSKKIESALDYTIGANYQLAEKAIDILTGTDNVMAKKAAISSIIHFSVTKNETISNNLINFAERHSVSGRKPLKAEKESEMSKKLDALIDKYVDNVLVVEKIENNNRLPVYSKVPIDEVVDRKAPTTILAKRKNDFTKNFIKDIGNIFKVFEGRKYPLLVQDFKIENFTAEDEVKKTNLKKITVVFKNDLNKKFRIEIMLPNMDKHGAFTINNYRKVLANQLVLIPVFYPEPYVVKLVSHYATISMFNQKYMGKQLYRIYVGGYRVYLPVVLFLQHDVKSVFKDFGINTIELLPKRKKGVDTQIKLSDGWYLVFDEQEINKSLMATSFYKALVALKLGKDKTINSTNVFVRDSYKNLIIKYTGNRNSPIIVSTIFDNFIDPVTKEILKTMGLPIDIYKLIVKTAKEITTSKQNKRNDLTIERVRSVEVITQLLYQQITGAYNSYVLQRMSGNNNATLTVNGFHVFKKIVNNQLVRVKENVCPLEQLSLATMCTYVGPGGFNVSAAITPEVRSIHDSAFGQLDPVDTPEGSMIGIPQHFSNGVEISDDRGRFKAKPITNAEGSGVLSSSSSMIPFISSDEPNRVIMSTNQSRAALPVDTPRPPMVQSGYESIYTKFLDDDFVKHSPAAGIVKKINDNALVIKDKHGKTHTMDLTPVQLKSGQIDSISKFKPTVKIGAKVKEGDVVAEGAAIYKGMICQGRNVLCALFDYDGYCFEDGIIVNEDFVNSKAFETTHYHKTEIVLTPGSRVIKIANVGEEVKVGDPLLVFSSLNVYDYVDLDEDDIIHRFINVKLPFDCKIIDIKIYPNEGMSKHPRLNKAYQHFLSTPEGKISAKQKGAFKIRSMEYEGVYVEIHAEYKMNITQGDKFANRHGNKGVISKVFPASKMPRTPFGKPLDMCFNPQSTFNRGIPGQLFEMYVGLISWKLKEILMSDNIKKFINSMDIVLRLFDKTKDKKIHKTTMRSLKNPKALKDFTQAVKELRGVPLIIPPFKEPTYKDIKAALRALGLKSKYKLFMPEFNTHTGEVIPIGYMYMQKIEHLAKNKISARSMKSYLPKTMQPPRGKSREGGQRLGELESWGLLSYNARSVLSELFGPLADDHISKRSTLQSIIETGHAELKTEMSSPTKDLVEAYMRLLLLDEG